MKPAAPRCLLLDIGMVLVQLNFNNLARRMQQLSGLEPARLQSVLNSGELIRRLETGIIEGPEFYEEVCRRAGIDVSWEEFLEAWVSIFDRPLVPDDVLASLARHIRLWAISNTNKLHFDFMSRRFTFLRHFQGMVLSHEVGFLKPDIRIFLHALEKTQTQASEVLFVDDQEANILAARSLGIQAIQFQNAAQFIAAMQAAGLL